jgi:hypothetical protein
MIWSRSPNFNLMRRLLAFALLAVTVLGLAACAPWEPPPLVFPTSDAPGVESAWGAVVTLGDAPTIEAPVLVAGDGWITAAWSDGESILVTRRRSDGGFLAQTAITTPRAPHGVRLAAAPGGYHLLWLDVTEDNRTRLSSALLDSELRVTLGAEPIATVSVTRYTLLESAGGLWVVWEGGNTAEPDLYAQWIDSLGRPRLPARLISDAVHPVLARLNSGEARLYWLRGRELHTATFTPDGTLAGDQIAGEGPLLARSEYLNDFSVGHDETHVYAFWNIVDAASGAGRSTLTAAKLAGGQFTVPRELALRTGEEITLETGFNTGRLRSVGSGSRPVTWAQPLAGQHRTLPVAVFDGFVLTMLYLKNGAAVAAQSIAPVDGPTGLIGPPQLITASDRHLYLTWAQPLDDRPRAALRYVSTRFLFGD